MKTIAPSAPDDSNDSDSSRRSPRLLRLSAPSHANAGSHSARHLPYKHKLVVNSARIEPPELNKTHIKSLAYSNTENGLLKATEHARASMLKKYGPELGELREQKTQSESNHAGIRQKIGVLTKTLSNTAPYHERHSASEPWHWLDGTQVVLLAVASLALPLVGQNTIAAALMSSGLPFFESPLACYSFSLIPLLFPFGLKSLGPLLCTSIAAKQRYHIAIWGMALFFGLVWLFIFSKTFPGMTQTVAEVVQSVSLDTTGSGSGSSGVFVFVSILAEGFFAAGCWFSIEYIVAKHRLSKRVANPAYETTQQEISHWRQLEHEEGCYMGTVQGRIEAIEKAIRAFELEAEGFFQTAMLASAHDLELRNILKQPNTLL